MERQRDRADAAHRDQRVEIPAVAARQVGAGAECATLTREHEHPVRGLCRDLTEGFEELERHLPVDRVALLGAVERDAHHPLAALDPNRLHRANLLRSPSYRYGRFDKSKTGGASIFFDGTTTR